MSKQKKKHRPPSPPAAPRDERQEIIRRRALIFRCPNSLADDFSHGCEDLRQDAEIEIDYVRVALELWSGRTGRLADLAAALTDLLAEHRRHDAALAAFRDRFDALADEEANPHEHIDPVERIQDLLRAWVFYDPPAA